MYKRKRIADYDEEAAARLRAANRLAANRFTLKIRTRISDLEKVCIFFQMFILYITKLFVI